MSVPKRSTELVIAAIFDGSARPPRRRLLHATLPRSGLRT